MPKHRLLLLLLLLGSGSILTAQQTVARGPGGHRLKVSYRYETRGDSYTFKAGARGNGKYTHTWPLGPITDPESAHAGCSIQFYDFSPDACYTGRVKFVLTVGGQRVAAETVEIDDCGGHAAASGAIDLTGFSPGDPVSCTAKVSKFSPRFAQTGYAQVASQIQSLRFPETANPVGATLRGLPPRPDTRGPRSLNSTSDEHYQYDYYAREGRASTKGRWATTPLPIGRAAGATDAFVSCAMDLYDEGLSCPTGSVRHVAEIAGVEIFDLTHRFEKGSCEDHVSQELSVDLSEFESTDELVCRFTVKRNKQKFGNRDYDTIPYAVVSVTRTPDTSRPE